MSPPGSVCSHANLPPLDSDSAGADRLLAPEELFCDASHPEAPDHWAQEWGDVRGGFRTAPENQELYLVLYDLRQFLAGGRESLSPSQRGRLEHWVAQADDDSARLFDRTVLNNLRLRLAGAQGAIRPRAQSLLEFIGLPETPPPPQPEEVPPEPETSAAPPEPTDSEPTDSFQLRSVSLETHFLDNELRALPSYYTLGLLPEQGLNQNLNSDFSIRAGVDASVEDYNLFFRFYGADGRPGSTPDANFGQAGVIVGLYELSRPSVGQRGEGFYASLGGVSQVGFGLGMGWCTSVDHSELTGVQCPEDPTFQISTVDEGDLFSLGLGPMELGVRLLPSTAYLNLSGEGLPEIDREPISFRLTYHLDSSTEAGEPALDDILRREVSGPETLFTGLRLFNSYILNNFRRRQEYAYETSRLLSLGNPDQYALLNTGSFFNATLSGLDQGSLAYRLTWNLRYGDPGQQAAVGALMGVEFLVNAIGALATPGIPETVETFPGALPPDGAVPAGREEVTNLQAQAFRLAWPVNLGRGALAGLGAVGAWGDINEAVRDENPHFLIAHSALGVGGLVLILTSGDFSGDGFFSNSILGNQPPTGAETVEVTDSRFSIGNQQSQFIRLETGVMLLSYAGNGLIDYLTRRLAYLSFQEREGSSGATSAAGAEPAPSVASSLRLQADLSPERAMLQLNGQF